MASLKARGAPRTTPRGEAAALPSVRTRCLVLGPTGEMALLTPGGRASATVRVADPPGFMECFALRRDDFDKLVVRHPAFRDFLSNIAKYRNTEHATDGSPDARDTKAALRSPGYVDSPG